MNHAAEVQTLTLRQLRLRPGMFLQARPRQDASRVTEAKFCAAIDGKGLMVVPLHEGAVGKEWNDLGELSVGGFTGQYDFRFPTRVLGSFSVPFAYVLLSYPDKVEARQVRSALRIRTSLPAMAWGRDPASTVAARVLDLSHAGALLELATPLGTVGHQITITFSLPLEGGAHRLELGGSICHAGSGAGGDGTRVGIAFQNPSRADKSALQGFALAQQATVVD
jgi:hypothetical protein